MTRPPRPPRTSIASLGGAALSLASLAACFATSPRGGGELESRFATVHNALTAIGMAEVGALHQARLAEGQETHLDLDLAAGCSTIVAVGSTSIADLDAALIDAAGTRVARGSAHTSEATIRACVEAPGTYALHLKATRGAGSLLVSTWSGAAPSELASAGRAGEPGRTLGTCDAPLPLTAGDFAGNTTRGERQNESKGCQNTTASEMVYKLEVASREKVTISVETSQHFDSVVYLRKGDCADADAEVACNDDASPPGGGPVDQRHSRIEQVLDPGSYFFFVDGYNNGGGPFKMHVEVSDVPPLAQLCSRAPLLALGTPVSGTTEGAFDGASASCGDGARGPDTAYALVVPQRSRVRVVEHSDDFLPVVHVRSRCDDRESAVGCGDSGAADHEAAFLAVLDPGRYTVFADSSQREASGKFTLTAETAPELGSGTRGERCADAVTLSRTEHTVTGDTFSARDDVAGQCGGAGAPDVVYRLDVAARTRLSAHLTREEGAHLLVLLRGCGGDRVELACGKAVEHLLTPGSYFLAVDGESPASFGAFTFDWDVRDTQAQDAACRAPPRLREGVSVSGTTLGGAVDKFSPSCAPADGAVGAPDAVYQLVVPARRKVHIRLHTVGWDAVLSVRKSCLESDTAGVAASELECHTADSDAGDIETEAVLDPGTYFVLVDGRSPSSAGPFTLEYGSARLP